MLNYVKLWFSVNKAKLKDFRLFCCLSLGLQSKRWAASLFYLRSVSMAKLTPKQWELAKQDYEIHGLSYSELVEKYGMSKGSISKRAKDECWKQGKNEHLIQKKVSVIKELQETEQQIGQLEPVVQKSIEHEVSIRLARENLFIDSALRNQKKANEMLDMAAELSEINQHSQITARNKETVLGKQPDTAIQINNGVESNNLTVEFIDVN